MFLKHTEKPINVITSQDIRYWLRLLSAKGYKPNTIRVVVTAFKAFFKYCLEEELLFANPAKDIPFPRKEEKTPIYLSFEQLSQLREVLGKKNPFEQVIFEVLYATGIRISELCIMKKEDIVWSERMILIPNGKGKKGRIVGFTRNCEAYLKAYLEVRIDDNPYVFWSPKLKNRSIHKSTVQEWFKGYSKEVGFRVTPHMMRHTFAAHLAKRGMPFEYLQALLGHEDPEHTRYYTRLFSQARKEVYDEWM